MKKGRSNYTFNINCDINLINNLMQNFIQAKEFKLEQKNGETYYKSGDAMIGYKYFNYFINGNQLIISAWFKNLWGEIQVEQNGLGSMNVQAMNYRNTLNELFKEINKINSNENTNNQAFINEQQNNNQANIQNNISQQTQNINTSNIDTEKFNNETVKNREKLCEFGFWLSILGLLASFGGITYGIIVYIMNFYFATQGLKTRKKIKAIATIVLSILSILIIIIEIITT